MTANARRLWVARHAKVAVSGVCYGQSDVPMAMGSGEAAALLLARLASAHAAVGEITDVWTSPFARTEPVAMLVAARTGARLHIDAQLAELSMGEWEGRRFEDIEREEPVRYRRWMEAWRTEAPPGGETLSMLLARVRAWTDARLAESGGGAQLVVTHAGVIRALRSFASRAPYEVELALAVEHLAPEPLVVSGTAR